MELNADVAAIQAAMARIVSPDQVVELRALQVPHPDGVARTFSGFFSDLEAFAAAAASLSDQGAKGVYFTPNAVRSTLLDRADNRVAPAKRGMLAKDKDIEEVRWFLVDLDPVRPSNLSASEEEKEAASVVARKMLVRLREEGWPDPLCGDSGNGYHMLYSIVGAETGVVKRALASLAFLFDTEGVKVDQTVHNPSRIWKVYGTAARKGEHTKERPWRLAKLFPLPERGQDKVTQQQLAALAGKLPSRKDSTKLKKDVQAQLDLWLEEKFPSLGQAEPWTGQGRRWVFDVCPWESSHEDRSAYIVQFNNGSVAAGCLHESCRGAEKTQGGKSKGWKHLQELVGEKFPPGGDQPPMPTVASTAGSPNLTDYGNALRMVRAFGGELLYCPTHGSWYSYDDKRWERDLTGIVFQRAKMVSSIVFSEVAAATSQQHAQQIQRFALRSESHGSIRAMVNLAETESQFALQSSRLDQDPMLFNVQNGTLNLRTGRLQEHDRTDLITKISPICYDPEATCPLWDEFLSFAMEEDAEVVAFINRFFGYSLTGHVSEQVLLFMEGTGCNGKTTAMLLLMHILGDYGIQGAPGLLVAKKGESHPTEVADLEGARFVANVEVDKGGHFAESLIKQLTGSDPIRARRMRQDFFQFMPTHKLCIAANHRPIIRGNDEGIWRRVLRIPWNRKIEDKDPFFLDKLKEEAPGILRKLVEGCLAWQQTGLQAPEKVRMATKEYREEMDVLSDFMEEKCVIAKECSVAKKALYLQYVDWCEGLHQRPSSYSLFNRQLGERDFKSFVSSVKSGNTRKAVRKWAGIGLQGDSRTLSPVAELENVMGYQDAEA